MIIKQVWVFLYMSDYMIPPKYVYFCKNLSNVLSNGILRDTRQTVLFLGIVANHLFHQMWQKITVQQSVPIHTCMGPGEQTGPCSYWGYEDCPNDWGVWEMDISSLGTTGQDGEERDLLLMWETSGVAWDSVYGWMMNHLGDYSSRLVIWGTLLLVWDFQ